MRLLMSATSVYKGASLKASEDFYSAEENEENYEDIEISERLSRFMTSLYAIKSDCTAVKLATLVVALEIMLILWAAKTAAARYCEDNPETIKRVWQLLRLSPISNETATQHRGPVLRLMGGIGHRH